MPPGVAPFQPFQPGCLGCLGSVPLGSAHSSHCMQCGPCNNRTACFLPWHGLHTFCASASFSMRLYVLRVSCGWGAALEGPCVRPSVSQCASTTGACAAWPRACVAARRCAASGSPATCPRTSRARCSRRRAPWAPPPGARVVSCCGLVRHTHACALRSRAGW